MSVQSQIGGALETELVDLASSSATELLSNASSNLLIHSIAYASAAGGNLTLDTYDGTTASRLRYVAIGANSDGAFTTEFVLQRGHLLRGAMASNAASIRVTYTILDS